MVSKVFILHESHVKIQHFTNEKKGKKREKQERKEDVKV